ncbi:unnamed protein product, partial [Didymodactylos carnosus]
PEGSSIEPIGWVEADITLAGPTFRHPVVLAPNSIKESC